MTTVNSLHGISSKKIKCKNQTSLVDSMALKPAKGKNAQKLKSNLTKLHLVISCTLLVKQQSRGARRGRDSFSVNNAAFHLRKSEVGAGNDVTVELSTVTTSRKAKMDASRKTLVVLGFTRDRLAIVSNTSSRCYCSNLCTTDLMRHK